MNRYAPLTMQELEAAPAVKEKETGELVSPVPENAPEAPLHPKLGRPSKVWAYRDANGKVLFYVSRFNLANGEKQILPLSLWSDDRGALAWRWKGIPSPRPLYGLDRLAANPESPVVIVEGEKTCDAAALVFPSSVCVTSCGGSQAAGKSDWSPLRGRKRVLIVPDNDGPGIKYANEVAGILTGMDLQVSIADVAGMTAPDGSSLPEKWDIADATGWPADELHKALTGAAKLFAELPPTFISWGDYEMTLDGLTVEVKTGKGENASIKVIKVCRPFEILGEGRDPLGHGWGKWILWHDNDNRKHKRLIPYSGLVGECGPLFSALADSGLIVLLQCRGHFIHYITTTMTFGRVTLVKRTGWHDLGGGAVFVLSDETIGPHGAETVILEGQATGPYERKGTLKNWQENIAKPAGEHLLCVLAMSTALAGTLLHLAGQEGGGVHFYGTSSKGKTTLLQILATVWGKGSSSGGYVRSWRATANGLEGAAASATDTALVLDELGQVEGRDAGAAIYGLSNGAGKARAGRDGSLRDTKTWRVLTISSGEIPVESKLSEDKTRKPRAGQMVRMLDVPIDRAFGVFDHDAGGDASKLAKDFKHAALQDYGYAGPEFIRRIINEGAGDIGEEVRQSVAEFIAATVPAGSDGQIDRAAQRLGLIAVAGELAVMFGILPWRAGLAREAAAWALDQWIGGRGGVEPLEVRQAIEQVRGFIEKHGESRFDSLDNPNAPPVNNRLGWRRGDGEAREWLIPPENWKGEICSGINATDSARVLYERGMLRRGKEGFSKVIKISSRPQRVFCLTSKILEGDL